MPAIRVLVPVIQLLQLLHKHTVHLINCCTELLSVTLIHLGNRNWLSTDLEKGYLDAQSRQEA